MIEAGGSVLYLAPGTDRFFLLPAALELNSGDFLIASFTLQERHLDEAALTPFEVTREQAQAHLRAEVERAVATLADTIGRALGFAGAGSTKAPDLSRIAERLGLSPADVRRDPGAAEAALRSFAEDVQTVSAAIASGEARDLQAARERLAARGIDLGDALDKLPGYLAAIRQLDQREAAGAAAGGLRALADAFEDQEATLGRRIDELIARLERQFGRFVGADPEREKRRRQEEYRASANAAIADALRAAGITPLGSADSETRDDPDA
jgi:hypothetical protein